MENSTAAIVEQLARSIAGMRKQLDEMEERLSSLAAQLSDNKEYSGQDEGDRVLAGQQEPVDFTSPVMAADLAGLAGLTEMSGTDGVSGMTDVSDVLGESEVNGGYGETNVNGGYSESDVNGSYAESEVNGGYGESDVVDVVMAGVDSGETPDENTEAAVDQSIIEDISTEEAAIDALDALDAHNAHDVTDEVTKEDAADINTEAASRTSQEANQDANRPEALPPLRAVIDVMAATQTWRKDRPGSEVRDIRSAITLNDRVLFINSLFSEDALLFQDTLTKLNGMDSVNEAYDFLSGKFPAWDFESELVYRFMMAVRRKLR